MAQEAAERRYARIQREPVPQGSPEFERKRQELFDTFAERVPSEYLIPQHYIDCPPRDVTSIPRECGILTDAELHITEQYDAFGLAHAIATRKLTAVEVTQAFLKRSIICDQISQCLTQWLPDLAMNRARQLDQHLEQIGKTVGPLHGVPISVKQHIPLAGTYSDTGFMSLIVFNEEDCHMISILRELGAVFYCKTAQPQAIMHLETDSYFGRTLNPHNIDLSAGGSSGGESALVALRGSVLGIGTDIGGSIRSPAGKCGIYGFKPTSYTLPTKDFLREGAACELNILASTGPLCNTMRDMELFMRSLIESKPWLRDPRLIPIPWTGLKTELGISTARPLKVGIMFDDGVIQPQPPVTRAMLWAQKLLSASSLLELKPYKPYKPAEAILSIRKMYWPDGGAGCYKEAEVTGEPIHKLTLDVIKDSAGFDKNAYQMLEDRMYRDRFRSAFAEDWTAQDVDVILCPMFVGPAPLHDTSFYWNYTALWNFVDCPGVVFPTPIKAGAKGSESYKDAKTWNEKDAHVRKLWEDNDYESAPIALQLVARKYHDNQLFGALALLSEYLGLK